MKLYMKLVAKEDSHFENPNTTFHTIVPNLLKNQDMGLVGQPKVIQSCHHSRKGLRNLPK